MKIAAPNKARGPKTVVAASAAGIQLGILVCVLLASVASRHALAAGIQSPEAAFASAMSAAMMKMMATMKIKPSHDIDRDFVNTMVPHHRGAIEMAEAELRYGRNERTRRLAQEIIVTQQDEIAAMRLSVGEPLPALER